MKVGDLVKFRAELHIWSSECTEYEEGNGVIVAVYDTDYKDWAGKTQWRSHATDWRQSNLVELVVSNGDGTHSFRTFEVNECEVISETKEEILNNSDDEIV